MPVSGPTPTTPRTSTRNSNFLLSVEVPADIARTTQITWTMTPYGTPTRPTISDDVPRGARGSPIEPGPALRFGVSSPSGPLHVATSDNSTDVFGDLVTEVRTTKHELSHEGLLNSVPAVPPGAMSLPPTPGSTVKREPQPPLMGSPAQSGHRNPYAEILDFPFYDNQLPWPDPSWPIPVYPREPGETHPDDPLPNVPIAPKKYYVVSKGLRLGVYYVEW